MEPVESEKQLIRDLANLSSGSEIVQHDGGWDSRVYSFDNERYFFKFPRTDKVKESFAREVAALKVASRLGAEVKVPKVLWEHPDNSYFGYEGVQGVLLNTVYDRLEASIKQGIGTALGEFLKRFHQCKLDGVPMVDSAEEIAQLHRWYEDVLPTIRREFSENEQSEIESLVYGKIPETIGKLGGTMRLGHGDLAPWNVIYDEGGRIGIIDFGKVCYCDPSRDLMYIGDEVMTEYSLRTYGDMPQLREKARARALYPEINSLMYYSGKGVDSGIARAVMRIKRLLRSM